MNHIKYPRCCLSCSNIWKRKWQWRRHRQAGDVGWRGTTLAGWHLCICENYICRNCFLSCACNMDLHDGFGFVSHPSSSSCHHIVCRTNSIWTCRKDRGTLRCDVSVSAFMCQDACLWLLSAHSAKGCLLYRLQAPFDGLSVSLQS